MSIHSTLSVSNFGQIREGSVQFGDLTILVGAQASGKSLFLQLFKLLKDKNSIFQSLQTQGFDPNGKFERILEMYFGESMSQIWNTKTLVELDKKQIKSDFLLNKKNIILDSSPESIFYIPAQRILAISQGWPKSFNAFEIGDPFVIKQFSERLRHFMEKEFVENEVIFPKNKQFSTILQKQIDETIFHGAAVELDKNSLRRRFLLKVGENRLPFMTWSAGQKEFMPLLLSLYSLLPSGNKSKDDFVEWVVIEEPEMGLHPQAIQTVLLLALQLMERGYKVVISTHSPVLLELVWVIDQIKLAKASHNLLFNLFSIEKTNMLKKVFESVINEKTFKTWYFQRENTGNVQIQDISSLDASSENSAISNWGGLSEFASRAVDIVSKLPEINEK
jgi:predicted ATP-dependent endonuclease of OLD family